MRATTLLQDLWFTATTELYLLPTSLPSAGACAAASSTILSCVTSTPVVLSTQICSYLGMGPCVGIRYHSIRSLSTRLEVQKHEHHGLCNWSRPDNEGLGVQHTELATAAQRLSDEPPHIVGHRARGGDRASPSSPRRPTASRHGTLSCCALFCVVLCCFFCVLVSVVLFGCVLC